MKIEEIFPIEFEAYGFRRRLRRTEAGHYVDEMFRPAEKGHKAHWSYLDSPSKELINAIVAKCFDPTKFELTS